MLIKLPVSLFAKIINKGDVKFLASHKPFGDFLIDKDLPYINDGDSMHLLDIWHPSKNNDNNIILFYIHGGGYVASSKDGTKVFSSWFTNQGFTVISMNYRLVTKKGNVSVYDQVKDVFAALNFIYENADKYNLKFDNFCLMGDSAGGHLSLMADLIYNCQEARQYYGIDKLPPISIKCLALNSTMYDYEALLPFARRFLSKNGAKGVFSKYCYEPGFMKNNSPKTYVRLGTKLDPIFNSSSTNDIFLKQSEILNEDAKKYGLDFHYYFDDSSKKEIGHVYNHFNFDNEGLKCNLAMCEFFKKHCNVE